MSLVKFSTRLTEQYPNFIHFCTKIHSIIRHLATIFVLAKIVDDLIAKYQQLSWPKQQYTDKYKNPQTSNNSSYKCLNIDWYSQVFPNLKPPKFVYGMRLIREYIKFLKLFTVKMHITLLLELGFLAKCSSFRVLFQSSITLRRLMLFLSFFFSFIGLLFYLI